MVPFTVEWRNARNVQGLTDEIGLKKLSSILTHKALLFYFHYLHSVYRFTKNYIFPQIVSFLEVFHLFSQVYRELINKVRQVPSRLRIDLVTRQ